jgi:UDP-glucose 4-epimerase
MRILVVGAFGFIGGRLSEFLIKAGHQVVLGTRKKLDSPVWLPYARVVQLAWDDDATLVQACKDVDVVIHAAGMNAQDCAADPVAALAFNGLATARLVAAATRVGVKKFIYLSTAHIYSSPLVGYISEETCPRNLHPYATSHLAGEHMVLSANSRNEIQGIVLRLSNSFGAPMHKDANCWMLLVNDLCKLAVEKRKLVLKTSGLQQRDFIGLDEVCRVTEKIAVANLASRQINIFNVGSGVSQTVLEMAQLIQQRCAKMFGYYPSLERVHSGLEESPPPLTYAVKGLNLVDISCENSDKTLEIDRLLNFCHVASA